MKDKKFLKVLRESLKADLEHIENNIVLAKDLRSEVLVAYYKGYREATERILVDIERHYELKDHIKVGGTD